MAGDAIAQAAAEVIGRAFTRRYQGVEWGPGVAAQDLADAGLLVTDGLAAIELVAATPFLHCMPCGATWNLNLSEQPLTVEVVLRAAREHLPHCIGEIDDA